MKFYFKIAGFGLMMSLFACDSYKDQHNHPDATTGKQLFEKHCAVCHTSQGTGTILLGVPANKDTMLTDSEILNKVLHGAGKDSKMQVFKTMPKDEAKKIIKYLRHLGGH